MPVYWLWDIHTLRDTLIDFFLSVFWGLLTVTDLYTANSVRVERNIYKRAGPAQQRIRERESVDFLYTCTY